MWKDPIIEEIHEIRRKLWHEAGENLKAYFERLKKIEEQYKDQLVTEEEFRFRETERVQNIK